MTVVFDAQPLTDSQKTGIGYCEAEIVKSMMAQFPHHKYVFPFFCFRREDEKRWLLSAFQVAGGILRGSKSFPASAYKLLSAFVPVPYFFFFGADGDITHFFNFLLPPGVRGKSVLTVHDMAYLVCPETVRFKTKMMLRLTLKKSCQRADKIVTISHFTKRELLRLMRIPEEKVVVVHLGVDPRKFFPRPPEGEVETVRHKYGIQRDYLLYVGTLEPRKNIERLIEAYSLAKGRLREMPLLVLAGRKGWLYDAIFERVTALQLQNDVLFPGYVEDHEVPALLSGALAFLFPSLYEGFGLPPLEAMACGTPVLTSNTSSLPEVAGDAALLVDPNSVEEIAEGIKRLVTDVDLRQMLSRQGLERSKAFTWERAAKRHMEIYESLAPAHARS